MATPKKPTASPSTVWGESFWPCEPTPPKPASHSAVVATISAAWLEGTHCSTHTTRPLAPTSMNSAVIAIVRHSRKWVGNFCPLSRAYSASRIPATTNRDPANSAGGNCCTPTRIARYVEPQMIYTAAKATMTFQRQAGSCCILLSYFFSADARYFSFNLLMRCGYCLQTSLFATRNNILWSFSIARLKYASAFPALTASPYQPNIKSGSAHVLSACDAS